MYFRLRIPVLITLFVKKNSLTLCVFQVDDEKNHVFVEFTPTIPHCSMATLIGLSIRVKLLRSLPSRFKVSTLTAWCGAGS